MNKDQRKFLIDYIEKEARKLLEEHDKRRPKEPSLNNYLVAAILDRSFQLLSESVIREKIREQVLRLGPTDRFLPSSLHHYGHSRKEDKPYVQVKVEDVFVFPPAYQEAYRCYEEDMAAWEEKRQEIESLRQTLLIKVQLGSDKALSRLIEQADNLGNLQLVNSRLLLTEESSK